MSEIVKADKIFEKMLSSYRPLLPDSFQMCEKMLSEVDFIPGTYYDRFPKEDSKDVVVSIRILFGSKKNKDINLCFYLRATDKSDNPSYGLENIFFKFRNKYYVINDFRKEGAKIPGTIWFYVTEYDCNARKFSRLRKEKENEIIVPDDFKTPDGIDYIEPEFEIAAPCFKPEQKMDAITYALHLTEKEYDKLPKINLKGENMTNIQSEIVTQILKQCDLDNVTKELLNLLFHNTSTLDENFACVICGKLDTGKIYSEIYLKTDTACVPPAIILNIDHDTKTSSPRISMLFRYDGCYYLRQAHFDENMNYCYTMYKYGKTMSVVIDGNHCCDLIDLEKFKCEYENCHENKKEGIRPRTRTSENKN